MLLYKSFYQNLMAVPTLIDLFWRLHERCFNYFLILNVILNCIDNSEMVSFNYDTILIRTYYSHFNSEFSYIKIYLFSFPESRHRNKDLIY